jgi:tetratricopeptide (TPR) repeat protein
VPRWLAIGLFIVALIAAVVVGALATNVYGMGVSRAEHDAKLQAACEDADSLRGARLLDEAIDAYGAIARVDPDWRCRGSDVAIGPGPTCGDEVGPLTVCDEAPRAEQREVDRHRWTARVMTASAWRDQVQAARQIGRERLEQASQYDRAFLRSSDPARRDARTRALNGYRVGLYIDPGAADSRREAQQMLTGFGGTTGRPAADSRCELAGHLFNAGLVPESRMLYAQALHSGRTTVCKRNGLQKERWTSAWALGELNRASTLHHTGNDDAAREAYIHAFAADSSLATARSALEAVPGPDPADAKTWATALHAGSDGWSGAETITEFVQGRPETLAAVAAVLGVLFLLACFVLQMIARLRPVRPLMDRLPPLRRFTRTGVGVEAFAGEGGDNGDAAAKKHIAEMTTGSFQHALRQPPLTKRSTADTDRGTLDVSPAVTTNAHVALTGEVLPPLESLQGVAAVLKWLINLIPREEIAITGQLLEAGDRGSGLRLHVFSKRGRPIKWRDFWHDDIRSMAAGDAEHDYRELARYAAAWVVHRALRPRSKGDWRPNGWFQVGVACQERGRYREALELYTKVLLDERFARNTALLHNLAVCRIRTGDYVGALEALDALDDEIGQVWGPKPEVKRPYSAGYNRALALQYVAMADRKHAAAKYAEALEVSKAVLHPLLASDAPNLAPAALMLHAGLLLSTADPLEPGRERHGDPPPAVRAASVAIARNVCPKEECPKGDALANAERASDIAYWVREQYGSDPRVLYNLACFEARLAARYPPLKSEVLKRAKADLKAALSDPRLKTWAPHDPALQVRTLADDEEWQELLGRKEPAAVA